MAAKRQVMAQQQQQHQLKYANERRVKSIDGEWYHSKNTAPGSRSYGAGAIKLSDLVALDFDTDAIQRLSREYPAARPFSPIPLTEEVKLQLLPKTPTGKSLLGATLVLAERWSDGNHIYVKGALYDGETESFHLFTSTTDAESVRNGNRRPTESHLKGWFIGQYRMAACLSFWRDLRSTAIATSYPRLRF